MENDLLNSESAIDIGMLTAHTMLGNLRRNIVNHTSPITECPEMTLRVGPFPTEALISSFLQGFGCYFDNLDDPYIRYRVWGDDLRPHVQVYALSRATVMQHCFANDNTLPF